MSFLNSPSSVDTQPIYVVTSILMSLTLSLSLAYVYDKTHAGATYSRSFVQTIILGSLVSTIMIFAIGNNVARGLGILGALTIIRFRTPIRDPRDMIFIFAALAIGVSCGSRLYGLGALGTLAFCITTMVLDSSPYSSRKRFDGLLRLMTKSDEGLKEKVLGIVKSNTKTFDVVAVREVGSGDVLEYAIEVHLLRSNLYDEIINDLRALEGVTEVNLVMQRDVVEL
ncbi:DUF4956 domain-containing protein [Puniceicoccaceae bacterium K14]|nr:DUF4956 domain-containing protein [Puniceicoccaceae bacterium K14]